MKGRMKERDEGKGGRKWERKREEEREPGNRLFFFVCVCVCVCVGGGGGGGVNEVHTYYSDASVVRVSETTWTHTIGTSAVVTTILIGHNIVTKFLQ